MLTMEFLDADGEHMSVDVARGLVAGWTGRDAAGVQAHIEELAEIGVPRPSKTPLFYQVPPMCLTQGDVVQVLGAETGGEAEPVIVSAGGDMFLTLGSDHTDRGLEAVSVAHSKAVCPKPVCRSVWRVSDVADRLDALELYSERSDDGVTWEDYQRATLGHIMPLASLIEFARAEMGSVGGADDALAAGTVLFCGTVPALGGVRPTPWFRASLRDPGNDRVLSLSYRADALQVVA